MVGYLAAGRGEPEPPVLTAAAPSGDRIAFVREVPCGEGRCQSLWLGDRVENASQVMTLDQRERCEAVAWSQDGYRMGFLINGYELRVFDSEPRTPVARVVLVEPDGQPSSRIARGITFSANGAAVTYDDCPRFTSGCRSGLAAVR
jgi:hypothetical protein